MEEETIESDDSSLLCCNLPKKRQWIWLYTVVPSTLTCFLHTSSVLVDTVVAYQLACTQRLPATGLTTFLFIYIPVVFTLFLKPPKSPPVYTCTATADWLLRTLVYAVTFPLIISVRLMKRVIWTVAVIRAKKPHEEVFHEYETLMSKEVHSYLFLQAFLHCCPQAVLQTHLLMLQVSSDMLTVYFQVTSLLVAVISLAVCTTLFHRYESQVLGGRTQVLLLTHSAASAPETAVALLPLRACVRAEVVSMDVDCLPGKVVAFFSWFFIVHSRILCLVIAQETHPLTTSVTVAVHYALMLIYLLCSQRTTLYDLPSRTLNAAISTVALVEVSVKFHKEALLYVLFFICIIAEDTLLTVLFFIYSTDLCSQGVLTCDHFGMYSYLIINSHVIGVVLFAIYLVRYQPDSKVVSVRVSPADDTTAAKRHYATNCT